MNPNKQTHWAVRNINGTSQNKCECKSWLAHWKLGSNRRGYVPCTVHGCSRPAEVGAHVQITDNRSSWQWWIAPLLLLIATGETYAMADMYLFSEVRGVVVKKGIPVEGAVVEQEFRWAWKDEVGLEKVKTDAEGKFSFPAVIRNSISGSLLPHEPMIKQTILIKHEGNVYKAWMFDKGDYKKNGELRGKPISLYCELEEPLSHKGNVYGICQLR